jgi:hypothetical protein
MDGGGGMAMLVDGSRGQAGRKSGDLQNFERSQDPSTHQRAIGIHKNVSNLELNVLIHLNDELHRIKNKQKNYTTLVFPPAIPIKKDAEEWMI